MTLKSSKEVDQNIEVNIENADSSSKLSEVPANKNSEILITYTFNKECQTTLTGDMLSHFDQMTK